MSEYTIEQVIAAFDEAQARIKSGKLANTPVNGLALSQYLKANNLEPTAENFYTAINQCAESLTWAIKPAQLVTREKNERPATTLSMEQATQPFIDKVKAAEIADAKAKADAASIQQAKDLISAYTPVKNTPRGQVIDYAEQARAKDEWTAALNKAVAGKRNLQEFAKTLATTIQKRYTDREKANERL